MERETKESSEKPYNRGNNLPAVKNCTLKNEYSQNRRMLHASLAVLFF